MSDQQPPDAGSGATAPGKQYDAFISYSHAADGALAPALQTGMQGMARPWRQRRAMEVFRDQTGLAVDPSLWQAILTALDASGWFVLLASPGAAQSQWVGKEIEHCLRTKGPDRIAIVLTEGTLEWDENAGDFTAGSTAVHPLLRGRFGARPRWVDLSWARQSTDLTLRNPRFRTQVAELVAPVRELDLDQLLAEDQRQRRRTSRVVRLAVGALATLLVLSVGAAALAWVNQRQADAARATAEQAAGVAEEQRAVAEEQARIARGRELAARALSIADEGARADGTVADPTLALLLAAQAQALGDTEEARAALLTLASGVGRDAGIVSAPAPLPKGLDPADVTSLSARADLAVVQQGERALVVSLDGGQRWKLPAGIWAIAPDGDRAVSWQGTVVRLEPGGGVLREDYTIPHATGAPGFDSTGRWTIYPLSQTEGGFLDDVWTSAVVVDLETGDSASHYFGTPICQEPECDSDLLAVATGGRRAVVRSAAGQLFSVDFGDPDAPETPGPRMGEGVVRFTDDGAAVLVRDSGQLRRLTPDSFAASGPPLSATGLGRLSFLSDDLALAAPQGCDGVGIVDGQTLAPVARIGVELTYAEGVGCEPDDPRATWVAGGAAVWTESALWPTGGEELAALVCASVGRSLSAAEREQYLGAAYDGPLACATTGATS